MIHCGLSFFVYISDLEVYTLCQGEDSTVGISESYFLFSWSRHGITQPSKQCHFLTLCRCLSTCLQGKYTQQSSVNMAHDGTVTAIERPSPIEDRGRHCFWAGRAGGRRLLLALIPQTLLRRSQNNKAVNLLAIKTASCWEVVDAYDNCLSLWQADDWLPGPGCLYNAISQIKPLTAGDHLSSDWEN